MTLLIRGAGEADVVSSLAPDVSNPLVSGFTKPCTIIYVCIS